MKKTPKKSRYQIRQAILNPADAMGMKTGGKRGYLRASAIVTLLAVTGWAGAGEADCDLFGQKKERVRVKIIQHKTAYGTDDLKFGFNVELGQTAGANGDYYSDGFVRLVTMLMPGALRYPGGTTANYFNWNSEKLDERLVVSYANRHINALLKRLEKENAGKVPAADLQSFSRLITNYNIAPFVVLNVFDAEEDIFRAIEKVKSKIKTRVYWELGNEVAYSFYRKRAKPQGGRAWGEEAYLKKIIGISKYIKEKYPQDKIGVVASEMAEWRNPAARSIEAVELRRKEWDRVVGSAGSYYDAVIVHPYIFATDAVIRDINVKCLHDVDLDDRSKYRLWIVSNISNIPSLYLKRLGKRYPGKEVWITEFGVMDPGGNEIRLKLEKHTGFRVLSSTANHVSWLAEYPKVSALLTHGLFTGYDWTHVAFPDYSYTANGIAYKFIQEYLSAVDQISQVSLDGYEMTTGVDAFTGMPVKTIYSIAGYDSRSRTRSLLVVNIANRQVELQLPWRAAWLMTKSFTLDERIKPGEVKGLKSFNRVEIEQNHIMLQPRSINVIKSRYIH